MLTRCSHPVHVRVGLTVVGGRRQRGLVPCPQVRDGAVDAQGGECWKVPYTFELADGATCVISPVMASRIMVEIYYQRGDMVVFNPSRYGWSQDGPGEVYERPAQPDGPRMRWPGAACRDELQEALAGLEEGS